MAQFELIAVLLSLPARPLRVIHWLLRCLQRAQGTMFFPLLLRTPPKTSLPLLTGTLSCLAPLSLPQSRAASEVPIGVKNHPLGPPRGKMSNITACWPILSPHTARPHVHPLRAP